MNPRVTYPVVVVGSGLAGLSTSVQLVKNKVPIVLLDKASSIGGNSVKASSGINGAGTVTQYGLKVKDSYDLFYKDTYRSAKGGGASELMEKLALDSADAIGWLQNEFGIKLDTLSQLGGHSVARTHRSSGKLPPGYEIVSTLRKALEGSDPELVQIKLGAKVVDVGLESGRVQSLSYVDTEGTHHEMKTNNVVFCTGGFSYSAELLAHHAPGLEALPTTNSEQTTGDGQKLLQKLGGQLIDMEQVQVHPTGFVDSSDRLNKNKFLAAEALRGNGAILLDPFTGRRFVNELDTRDAVTAKIQEVCKDSIAYLVMSEDMYKSMSSHMDFYLFKKLIHKVSVAKLAATLGKNTKDIIQELIQYSNSGADAFGRTHKINTFGTSVKPETEIYYGEITPVVHFTMGGARINKKSEVLNEKGEVLAKGLYAAGEVSGGVHGANRLGGSSLLECVVYGRQAANSILHTLNNP